MPWEYRHRNMWEDPAQRRIAIRQVFDSILQKGTVRSITADLFKKMGVASLLVDYYGGSPYLAIKDAYPGKFMPWELGNVPLNYWSGERGLEHATEAMSWLAKKLGIPVSDLTKKQLLNNGLGGMITHCFDSSFKRAKEHMSGV